MDKMRLCSKRVKVQNVPGTLLIADCPLLQNQLYETQNTLLFLLSTSNIQTQYIKNKN